MTRRLDVSMQLTDNFDASESGKTVNEAVVPRVAMKRLSEAA